MNLPKLTLVYGILLIVLGVVGYNLSDRVSVTALIPAFFGVLVCVLGVLARHETLRKHMMHVLSLLALVGFLGTVSGLAGLAESIGGGDVEQPMAAISRSIMAVLSLAYFGFCLRSFIKARAARKRDNLDLSA